MANFVVLGMVNKKSSFEFAGIISPTLHECPLVSAFSVVVVDITGIIEGNEPVHRYVPVHAMYSYRWSATFKLQHVRMEHRD